MHERENFKYNKTTNTINPFMFLEIHNIYEIKSKMQDKKRSIQRIPPTKDTKNMVKLITEANGLKDTVEEVTGIPSPEQIL